MNNSILLDIKKLLGSTETYTYFDTDLIIHINSVLAVLNQLGLGPEEGFSITGSNEVWGDFIGDSTILEDVKTFIYLKVKQIFDPPTSGSHMDSLKELIKEFEWRLNVKETQ